MLESVILIPGPWSGSGPRRISEIANRQAGERAEASGDQDDQVGGDLDLGAAVGGRAGADPAGEQAGEAADAGEADLEADVGDRGPVALEELARAVEAGLDPHLVRGHAEERVELADEVIGRDRRGAGDRGDRERRTVDVAEEIAGAA